MNANELMILIMCLWSAWFFFGGSWAVIRVVIGAMGFKDGENKWSGFKGLMWWFLINFVITGWYFIEFGGAA